VTVLFQHLEHLDQLAVPVLVLSVQIVVRTIVTVHVQIPEKLVLEPVHAVDQLGQRVDGLEQMLEETTKVQLLNLVACAE